MTFNQTDYYGMEDYDRRIDQWEELTIQDQIDLLNQAWEDKTGEVPTYDLDMADYYTISPNGSIPW